MNRCLIPRERAGQNTCQLAGYFHAQALLKRLVFVRIFQPCTLAKHFVTFRLWELLLLLFCAPSLLLAL